jgi:amino acid adenylation domain-containing protein/thioester reductase-like protein
MQKDEGLSTKLWLEERDSQVLQQTGPAQPQIEKFTLSPIQQSAISAFLKSTKLQWHDLAAAAWSLLIDRLSTADITVIGYGNALLKAKKPCMIHAIKPIKSVINESITIAEYLQSIKDQTSSRQKVSADTSDEIKYLLLLQTPSMKSAGASNLNVNFHTLNLLIEKKKTGQLQLIYNPLLYRKHRIKQIIRYFNNILDSILNNIQQPVTHTELLDSEEKNNIINNWSTPAYDFETPAISKPIHQLADEIAKSKPKSLAITHGKSKVSYSDLKEYSDRIAALLLTKKIGKQDKIAVIMDRAPLLVLTMLGIFKSDCVFVPINTKYPNDRIEFVLEDCDAKYILATNKERVPEKYHDKTLLLPTDWQQLPKQAVTTKLPNVCLDSVAYIIYTSGTTGQPKGVMINHGCLTNLTAWYSSSFEVTAKDRASQFASQGFDTYLCETAPILALGASVHIVDDNIKLTPALFFDWLKKNKITILDLPTAYALMLFDMQWPERIDVRLTKIGGEACTRYPDQIFPFDIWNIYGPTETTIEATYQRIYQAKYPPNDNRQNETPPIGKILANCQVYVVDQHMQLVPEGVAGEILIGGACVSPGYLKRPELSAARFIDNPFVPESSDKLYKTGDLAKWLPDGSLSFIGRKDNQVKIRGYRIELGDIESALSKYPDVSEVAVIAKEAMSGEKTIIAYVVPNLDKERYLYSERCLLSVKNDHFIEAISEDISKHGIALSGITERLEIGTKVTLHIKLPGFNEGKNLTARLIWQIDNRSGFVFDLNDEEMATVSKCIDYFLAEHNVMDLVLTASAKRSLRKALRNKLPEYMVPTSFVTLTQFPLTFSGKIDLKALPPPDDHAQILQKHYVPPKTSTEKKITAIWQDLLNKKEISMEDNFFDLGGTSLTAAELSVKIMEKFKISVPAKILFDLSYIPILAEYIDTKGEQYSTETIIQEDIKRDCILHGNITPTEILSKSLESPKSILLTGAGGFLGIFMLNELLQTTNAKIYCLVRKGEFESAAKKINATIKKFGLEKEMSLSNRRIVAVPSDLSLDHFGLPLEQYRNMAKHVDLIYHCGAQVNIMASYNKLRGSNVQGTLEIIKFATHTKDKPIHYVSTLSSAYLKDEHGALSEEFPTETYHDLFGGYAISKWVSERLLTELKNRGCPVMIYRSGYISGRESTGITSLNDALLMLIKGCIQLGYAPDMHEKVTILPVDYVSKAIIAISLNKPTTSSVYHIDHPIGIMWTDLVNWLNDYGYNIKLTSMKNWKSKLTNIPTDNALYPFLPYYLALPDDHASLNVVTDKATKVLKDCGLPYPEINDKLLSTYIDYLCQEGFMSAPKKKKKKTTT